jgi:hypothetical protein
MPRNLWELAFLLKDIRDLLDHAEALAYELSGGSAGRAADPEYGIPEEPAVEGWPLMERVGSSLFTLRAAVDAIRLDAELVAAVEAEKVEMDEYEARADAASY